MSALDALAAELAPLVADLLKQQGPQVVTLKQAAKSGVAATNSLHDRERRTR